MSRNSKDRRLKVLRLYEKGVSVTDCARLAGVAYETARRYCREADFSGIEQVRKASPFRVWPLELKKRLVCAGLMVRVLLYLLGNSTSRLLPIQLYLVGGWKNKI